MSELNLKAEKRDLKENLQNLRKQGFIPGVIYGKGVDNINIKLNSLEFKKISDQARYSAIVQLELDGDNFPVLIQDVSYDTLKNELEHVDFYKVDMDSKIIVEPEVLFINQSPAVKEKGGILIKNLETIKLECLPSDLISKIEIDLSILKEADDKVLVRDLDLPDTVKVLTSPDIVICSVKLKKKADEKVKKEEETATPADAKQGEANGNKKEEPKK